MNAETAENKLLRDAINQQLAQLRDWANDAERRCKAETAAKEAETERADRLAKEISGREELYAILRGICEDAIDWIGTLSHDGIGGEALNHPLTVKIRQKMQRMYEHPIDNKLLKRADQIEAAEERADRAVAKCASTERALREIINLRISESMGYMRQVNKIAQGALSPIPSPAKPEEKP